VPYTASFAFELETQKRFPLENALHDPVEGLVQRKQWVPTYADPRLEASYLRKWAFPGYLLVDLSIPAKKDVRRVLDKKSIMLSGLVLWRTRVPTECKVPESYS
jgi:hypothetical protein